MLPIRFHDLRLTAASLVSTARLNPKGNQHGASCELAVHTASAVVAAAVCAAAFVLGYVLHPL